MTDSETTQRLRGEGRMKTKHEELNSTTVPRVTKDVLTLFASLSREVTNGGVLPKSL